MSIIGKNIRKIRTLKGLTQTSFAENFGIKRASISAYEEGRANPKNDLLIKIAREFNLSMEQMITKELTINELSGFNLNMEIKQKAKFNPINNENISFVSEEMFAAYLNNNNNVDFCNKLPVMSLPFDTNGAERAFECTNVELKELPKNCICYAKKTDVNANNFNKHAIYLIIMEESYSLRFVKSLGKERLLFDTAIDGVKSQEVNRNKIMEIWEVLGITHFNINLNSLENRIKRLEEIVHQSHGFPK